MKQILASVTQRGQVTIPVEVRRLLGTGPRGKVVFQIDGDEVRLMRPAMTLEEVFASVSPLNQPEDFKQISREARDDRADDVIREMRGR